MKKLFLILLAISMLLTFISCSSPATEPAEETVLLPKPDEKLEFWLRDNVDNVNLNEYKIVYGEGSFRDTQVLYGKSSELEKVGALYVPTGSFIRYSIANYTNESSVSMCISAVEINDPSIDIYGLNVNSSHEEFIQKFVTEKGFAIEFQGSNYIQFKRDDCFVRCEEGKIIFCVWCT